MVGWVRVRSPPVLESKLLCVSLLYLLTTLPLALYVSFSDPGRRCPRLLLPSFASPAKPELFEYPPGYGERKHALPVTRALCSSPVAFAGLRRRPGSDELAAPATCLPFSVRVPRHFES